MMISITSSKITIMELEVLLT